jgi:hypothetical protein
VVDVVSTNSPKAPSGLGAAGRKLWRSVLADYELEQHEIAGLLQACRAADACDELQEVVASQGRIQQDHLGNVRIHPAAVELRQTQMLLLRAVASLRIPLGDDDGQGEERPQRRGAARGPYGIVA